VQVLRAVAEAGGSVSVFDAVYAYQQELAADIALQRRAALLAFKFEELLYGYARQLQEQARDGVWRLRGNYVFTEKPFLVIANAVPLMERTGSKWTLAAGCDGTPGDSYQEAVLAALTGSTFAQRWHMRPGCEYQLVYDLQRNTVSLTFTDGNETATVAEVISCPRLFPAATPLRVVLRGAEQVSTRSILTCGRSYLLTATLVVLRLAIAPQASSTCGCGTPGGGSSTMTLLQRLRHQLTWNDRWRLVSPLQTSADGTPLCCWNGLLVLRSGRYRPSCAR
jgi:YD repeat-containing protein